VAEEPRDHDGHAEADEDDADDEDEREVEEDELVSMKPTVTRSWRQWPSGKRLRRMNCIVMSVRGQGELAACSSLKRAGKVTCAGSSHPRRERSRTELSVRALARVEDKRRR
jgi:D-serine deaminase-like pyridoxal phosphate-dependent protein